MHDKPIPVITVDGPSGVGKGTISQFLAETLGWHYLDSGALYRIVAYAAFQNELDLESPDELLSLIKAADIKFHHGAYLNGERIEDDIRTEAVGDRASRVAKHAVVRGALLELQHRFLQAPGLVADGRDMGTTVFPQAAHKFYLVADAQERAKRRAKQLMDKGLDGNIAALFRDIQQRDERDMNRTDSPLCPADDAIIIDTTQLGIDDVLEKVIDFLPYEVST
jgi:cytidylate kinase